MTVLANARTKHAVRRLPRSVRRLFRLKVLFCGLPVSAGQSNLLLAPSVNADQILARLDGIVTDVASSERANLVCYKEFEERDHPVMNRLDRLGYLRAESPAMYTFRHRFADFDEYLSALRSRYRYPVRQSMRKAERAGVRFTRYTNPDIIERLYDSAACLRGRGRVSTSLEPGAGKARRRRAKGGRPGAPVLETGAFETRQP